MTHNAGQETVVRTVGNIGHQASHAAMRAGYDLRHPDAPLPKEGEVSHAEIHNLLAVDLNASLPPELRGTGWPTEIQPLVGHIEHHNVLHAAYNAMEDGTMPT